MLLLSSTGNHESITGGHLLRFYILHHQRINLSATSIRAFFVAD
jgi:hypothetical protein